MKKLKYLFTHLVALIFLSGCSFAPTSNNFSASNRTSLSISTSQQSNPQQLDFYLLDDGTYGVGQGLSTMLSEIVVPAMYRDRAVTQIVKSGFNNSNMKAISLPESIIAIGDHAFSYCTSLTSIVIPSCTTSIGSYAFSNCSSLTSIIIPDCVTFIGDHAFKKCSALVSASIGKGVTSIGNNAFSDCTSLVAVTISDNLYAGSIGVSIFDNRNIADAYIQISSIEQFLASFIGDYFYYNFSNIHLIDKNQKEMFDIIIPDAISSIHRYAFCKCTSITSVVISDGVASIDKSAFAGCSSLVSVVIGSGVTSIGDGAFSNCNHLFRVVNKSSLNIRKGSESFGYVAYHAREVINDESESKLCIDDNGLVTYIDDSIVELVDYIGKEENLTIQGNINRIGADAFYKCNTIKTLIISDSVTSIGDGAFQNCSNLTSITIGSGVTSIGGMVCQNCPSLTSIYIGKGVAFIGGDFCYNCQALLSIEVDDDNLYCTSFDGVLFNKKKTVIWYFPKGRNNDYVIPNSVTFIDNYAFDGCSSLTIYCEAETKPSGWNTYWNSFCPVVWNYSAK